MDDLCSPHRLWCIIDTVKQYMENHWSCYNESNNICLLFPTRNEIFDKVADCHCSLEDIVDYINERNKLA